MMLLNFCCWMALNVTSIYVYSLGFNFPSLMFTENYLGRLSTSFSLYLIGTAQVFLNLNCLLIIWFKRILVKTMGDPYNISIEGLDPRHFTGITKGFGLFFIITINSSLYYLASIGIAQTLSYFEVLPGSIDILSLDKLKTFLLYSGFPSMIELKNAN